MAITRRRKKATKSRSRKSSVASKRAPKRRVTRRGR
jgi:hypothetical protein